MNNKYFLQIYGCQMNYSDAERISFIMNDIGYQKTKNKDSADVIIFVTCSVRQTAEDRVFGSKKVFEKLKKSNPNLKVILTGCMTTRDFRKEPNIKKRQQKEERYQEILKEKLPWVDHFFKIGEITKLYTILGKKNLNIDQYLSVKPKYDSKYIAYVPISTGCNNFCSYCIVPLTRGAEVSRPFKEVVQEVKELIFNGYKEINLLGQNVNSYGNDLQQKNLFPKLLKEIDEIEGDFWIRFVSCHPKDVSEELIDVLSKSKHIVHQVHFALQSGNNEILKKMNRPYTRELYINISNKFKEKIPNIALTTDVIVGFPGETTAQFLDTKTIMEEVGFTMVYMNKYSPRKGTKSADLIDNVSWKEKGERKNILNEVLTKTSAEYNTQFLNQKIKVLITGKKGNWLFGHNAEGIKVKVLSKENPLTEKEDSSAKNVGEFIISQITETGSWGIKGVL